MVTRQVDRFFLLKRYIFWIKSVRAYAYTHTRIDSWTPQKRVYLSSLAYIAMVSYGYD